MRLRSSGWSGGYVAANGGHRGGRHRARLAQVVIQRCPLDKVEGYHAERRAVDDDRSVLQHVGKARVAHAAHRRHLALDPLDL